MTFILNPYRFSAPPNLLLDAHEATVWQDTSRTIAGGDGILLGSLDNRGTDTNHLLGTSSTDPVYLSPDPDTGLACLEFNSGAGIIVGSQANMTISSMSGIAQFGFACLLRPDEYGTTGILLSIRDGSGVTVVEWHTPQTIRCRSVNQTGAGADIRGGWHTLIATWDGANVTAYVDGVSLGTYALSGSQTPTVLRIPFTSVQAGSKVNYLRFENRSYNADTVASWHATLNARIAGAVPEDDTPTAMSPTDLNAENWWDSIASAVLRNGGSEASGGGSVTDWQPSTGSLTMSQPGGLNAPTRETHLSTTVVQFPNSGTPSLSVNLGATRTVTQMTIHVVARLTQHTATVPFLTLGTNRGHPRVTAVGDPTSQPYQATWSLVAEGVGIGLEQCGQHIVADGHWHVWSFVYNGDERLCRLFIDGCECVPGVNNNVAVPSACKAAASFTQGGVGLGYQAAGIVGGFQVASVSIHLAEHTPAQCRGLLAWARSYYSSLFAGWDTDPVICWTGSSNLLVGNGSTDHSVPRLCLAATAEYSRVYNLAMGSLRSEEGLYRLQRQVKRLLQGRTGKTILPVYFGGNDFKAGLSVANIQAMKMRYKDALLAATPGTKVVIEGTQLPGTGVSDTDRATVNTYLGTQVSATYKLANIAGNTEIGDNGDHLGIHYLDGTHLDDSGCEQAATGTNGFSAAIDAELP